MFGQLPLRKPRVNAVILTTFFLLIIAGILFSAFTLIIERKLPPTPGRSAVTVPALVGQDMMKAKAEVKSLGLTLEVDQWVEHKVYPINHIISQEPSPNTKIRKGTKIVVKVSGGGNYPAGRYTQKQSVAKYENLKPLPNPPIRPLKTLSGKIVVIDPGHQSCADLTLEPIGPGAKKMKEKVKGGTTGVASKKPEYQVTLEISRKLKAKLELYGIKVAMTREKHDINISNVGRAQIANNLNADLFIRIHADGSSDPEANGISTLCPASNTWTAPICEDSRQAAQIIQQSIIEETKRKDNGIIERSDITAFNWSEVPVILVETGFLTNPEEDLLLNDTAYQNTLVSGISQGVIEYLKTRDKG